jgi:hypothetical protein
LQKIQRQKDEIESNIQIRQETLEKKDKSNWFTLSMAIPSSYIDKILLKELRTLAAGQVNFKHTQFMLLNIQLQKY